MCHADDKPYAAYCFSALPGSQPGRSTCTVPSFCPRRPTADAKLRRAGTSWARRVGDSSDTTSPSSRLPRCRTSPTHADAQAAPRALLYCTQALPQRRGKLGRSSLAASDSPVTVGGRTGGGRCRCAGQPWMQTR